MQLIPSWSCSLLIQDIWSGLQLKANPDAIGKKSNKKKKEIYHLFFLLSLLQLIYDDNHFLCDCVFSSESNMNVSFMSCSWTQWKFQEQTLNLYQFSNREYCACVMSILPSLRKLTMNTCMLIFLLSSVTAVRAKFIGLYTSHVWLSTILNVLLRATWSRKKKFESILVFIWSTWDHIHALTCHLEFFC